MQRSSIAQFFNVNSTKNSPRYRWTEKDTMWREGGGNGGGGKKKEIARSYFNLNQGNHSREATFTTGNCCSRRYSSNSGGIVHWKRQGKMSFLPFPPLHPILPLPFSFARTLIIFKRKILEIRPVSPRMDFYLLPRKFTFVLRIPTDRLCNRIAGRGGLCPRIVCK